MLGLITLLGLLSWVGFIVLPIPFLEMFKWVGVLTALLLGAAVLYMDHYNKKEVNSE